MLAQIYTGCKCGETWRVQRVDHIDCDRDKIYSGLMCSVCFSQNLKKKETEDGVPYMHEMTHDEIMWEISLAEDEDDDDYNDYRSCSTCGGEFWDGGTSCDCEDWEDDQDYWVDFMDDLPF